MPRRGLGGVELGKKLFNLSINDAEARSEAKRVLKETAHEVFVGSCVLAAAQGAEGFKVNDGAQLRAEIQNARDLFNKINLGLNPLGNYGEFIPNESFTAIYQDAQEAVSDAREAEIEAREERRLIDQNQAALRNELQNQRASYITPLQQLTGVDPVGFNNLKTKPDQDEYRQTFQSRIDALIASFESRGRDGNVSADDVRDFLATADFTKTGEFGDQVLSIANAILEIQSSYESLRGIYRQIEIKRDTFMKVSLTQIATDAMLNAYDLLKAEAESVEVHTGTFTGVTISVGKVPAAAISGMMRNLQTITSLAVSDLQMEEQIKGMLLEAEKMQIQISQAHLRYKQELHKMDLLYARMDRLIEDLAQMRATASELYFMDPSYRLFMTEAQRRAEAELEYAIDKLYRLAKTLQWEWLEKYQNPVTIPVASQEPPSLENSLFDKFGFLEDVFGVRTADEAKDYLDALKAWDSKLRRYNVASVRGPNHQGPFTAMPISLRQQILGYRYTGTNPPYTPEESLKAFRDFLENSREANPYNPTFPNVAFEFSTTIEDTRFFPIMGGQWNMRIHSIAVDIYSERGFNGYPTCDVQLIQAGNVSFRTFFARPPSEDDTVQFAFNSGDRPERSIFNITVPCRINDGTGGRPPSEFDSLGLRGRPVAASQWKMVFDTSNPYNHKLDFSKIKDIYVRFTYTYGNPEEFPGF